MRQIDFFLRRASKFVTIGVVALHFAVSSYAQDSPNIVIPKDVTRVQTVEGITEYRLGNGLKVLLAPDASDDKVTVNLTYMVGSRHEGQGEGGMAHLLEHLVFKGTPKTPDPKQEFRKRGFTFNGTTTSDRTNYFATFTSSQEALDWYIGWQADAMVNSFIAKKDLDSEMTVVRNEFEIAGNNPFQLLGQKLAHAAYETHAYGKPTVGNKVDIENVEIEKLQAFYKRYYRPDNAVLIVAGKFDVSQTLAAIQLSLGQLKKPTMALPPAYGREAPQDGERTVIVRRPAPTQVIIANYHVPGAMHPDAPALNVLATLLGDVPSGRLHKALVESKLTLGVFAASVPRREAGTISFVTGLAPTEDGAKSQKILIDTVEGVAIEAIRQDEFERAKTKILKSLELGFANAAAVAAGAIDFEVAGDWRGVFVNRERLKAVTLDDVNRVARTYLLRSNRTLGQLIPTTSPVRAPELKMPDIAAFLNGFPLSEKGLESVAFDYNPTLLFDKLAITQTPSAIKMAALVKPVRGDLVKLNIAFRFGTAASLRDVDIAATMASSMLYMGTTKLSRQQIQDELVKLGASLNMGFSSSGGNLSLTAKKENVLPAFQIALHLLKDSTFPEKEFEEVRATTLKALEGSIKDKSAQANNAWQRYGNPYSKGDPRYASTLEEAEARVKSVSRKEAYEFYRRFYGAANAQVTVLGPIDVKAYEQNVLAELEQWQSKEPWKRIENPMVDLKPARLTFDTPDKSNTSIRAGHNLPVSWREMPTEDFALSLATRIFGGGPGSRLWNRLREKGGLSYTVGANYGASAYERNASFSMNAEVAPENVSAAENALKEELRRSLEDGFTDKEVEKFKGQYLADRVRNRSGDGFAMSFMSGQLEYEHPKGLAEKNDALIRSLTTAQINEAWRKYIDIEKLVWGIFGDQSKIK